MSNMAEEYLKIEGMETGRGKVAEGVKRELLMAVEESEMLRKEVEEVVGRVRMIHSCNNMIVRSYGNGI